MTNQQPTGGFAKAFVPGLVLGIIIGAFAGATLPALLAEKKLPEHTGVPSSTNRTDREREALPPTLTDPELDPTLDSPPAEGDPATDDAAETDDQTPPPDDNSGEDDGGG